VSGRAAASLPVLALLLACAPAPATPEAAVAAWYDGIARDPVRAFLLLDDAYHAGHGLSVPLSAEPPDPDEEPAARRARGRVGWLEAWKNPVVRERARELRFAIEDTWREEGRAGVRARVRAPGGADFVQVFDLVREAGGWRIAGIEQRGLEPASWGAAYAAAPSLEGYLRVRRLERARERRQ